MGEWQKIKIRWTKQLLPVTHHKGTKQPLTVLIIHHTDSVFLDQVNDKSLFKHQAESQIEFAKA